MQDAISRPPPRSLVLFLHHREHGGHGDAAVPESPAIPSFRCFLSAADVVLSLARGVRGETRESPKDAITAADSGDCLTTTMCPPSLRDLCVLGGEELCGEESSDEIASA